MVILERSFGGDKREKMNQGDRKGGNRFEPLNNDTDNPDIDDMERAIRLSLMDQERGGGGLVEAAHGGLPDQGDLNEQQELELALRRSEREEAERKRKEREEEEDLIRQGIETSLKETKEPLASPNQEYMTAEDYEKQFQQTLQLSRTEQASANRNGGPGSSPGHGKHRKRSRLVESSLGAGASGHRAETGPNDLRRIQEDQELFEAINQSKKEEELRRMRGGGGTNVPLDNQIPVEVLDEEAQLQLAIELSKKNVSPFNSGASTPGVCDVPETPPALQRPVSSGPVRGGGASTNAVVDRGRSSPFRDAVAAAPPTTIKFGSSTTSTSTMASRQVVKPDTAGVGRKGERRPIVVDGCNVGFQHGKNKVFRAKGLQIVFDYFISKGWEEREIVIFLKPVPTQFLTEEDHRILEYLEGIDVLHYTNQRRLEGQRYLVDDDEMVLKYAFKKGGVILSKDQFRDAHERWSQYREIIRDRLLGDFNFIGDDIIFPDTLTIVSPNGGRTRINLQDKLKF